MKSSARIFWIFFLLPFAAHPAFGWGCEGHEIVALIARAHLSPAVSAAVDALLNANPIDPALRRFCQNRPPDAMADSSTWADDSKNEEKTGVWHYVDIPLAVNARTSLDPWCPPVGPSVDGRDRPGCITDALEYELGILRDRARPTSDRAKALRYVIHFAGDIHQPLHDVDNGDRGGNCTVMQFFDDARPANLHAIWDYRLIERQLTGKKTTEPAYAADLNSRFAGLLASLSKDPPNDPDTWAWQTHALAARVTYGALQPPVPVEKPAEIPEPNSVCDAERNKVQALHITIGEEYFAAVMPVIDQQLATAGFRLANLLNNVLQ